MARCGKALVGLSFVFLVAGPDEAQNKNQQTKNPSGRSGCEVYFTVLQSDAHLPGGSIAAMSADQEKWWKKNGAKKFPGVCYDSSIATYKIVWWRDTVGDNFVAKNVADPRFDTTIHRTRDIGYAYVKLIGTPDADKPLFFADRERKGTARALEKAVAFLSRTAMQQPPN